MLKTLSQIFGIKSKPKAYKEGEEAYYSGKSIHMNPYDKGSENNRQWIAGYYGREIVR